MKFFELIFFLNDQKIWEKFCRADLSSVSRTLTCWLFISVVTPGFLGSEVTGFLQSIILETNNLWGSSFFSKYSKFYADFRSGEKNSENVFWFGYNCIWIGCVKHSFLLRKNTFHWEPICSEKVWRFQIIIKNNFLSLFFCWIIKKSDKNSAVQIEAAFRTL